jgi:hypothetical protein
MSRKHNIKKFLSLFIVTILFGSTLIHLNPYDANVAKLRAIWWRIWYEGDTIDFFNILISARAEYDRFDYSNDILVIVPVTGKIVYPIPFCFYIKSFFPNAIVAYFADKNLTSAEIYSRLYSSSSYPYEHWSVTIDGKSIKDYPIGRTKIFILFLRGYFEPSPDIECYQKFKEFGYCLYMLT